MQKQSKRRQARGMRIASISGANTRYFHKDHLGSTSAVTDGSGNIVETADYKPSGGSRDYSGSVTTQYKYTDQEFDPESGLYNYNARLYDPAIGRFISADSIVQSPFGPQTLNRYSYVGNNPLNNIDPTGESFLSGLVGAIFSSITAALTGGDVGDAFVQGFITGFTLGAVSAEFAGVEDLTKLDKVVGYTMAGTVSGGLGSGFTGNDVEFGALAGGVSSLFPQLVGAKGFLEESLVGGVSGGVLAETQGGNFLEGFAGGFSSSTISYASYTIATRTGMFPGKGPKSHHYRDDNMDLTKIEMALDVGNKPDWHFEGFPDEHGGLPTWRGVGKHNKGWQVTFRNGWLVKSGFDKGTYDYSPPYRKIGNKVAIAPIGAVGHFFVDVMPWVLWGN